MKAQVIKQFGDPSVFTMVDLPIPSIESHRVLIRICATSVNQIDCKIRSGAVPAITPEFPAILQGDVAGVIEAVGSQVTNFKKGDEVYGFAGGINGESGALAEFIAADSRLIAKKPRSLSMIEAAALPLVSITAWESLFDKAKISQHDQILIHGGVGGVGHVAVQLAKWYGAKIAATILKKEDVAILKEFGADDIINAKDESVADYIDRVTQGNGFDVIFDTVGGANLDRSLEAANLNGRVVTIAARSTHDLTPMHNKALTLHAVFTLLPLLDGKGREHHGKILQKISEIVDAGKLKPLIDPHRFSLETVGEAHALLESGKARGKVVILVR